ncbi:AEC family transporter [Clostridium botulinum]|uniref:AEC family transporter n=1 Tax=Clostridium sp. ZBS13 TaxID=2949971 RepID=UPI001D9263F7|nr:AEC family transporter [Clostridium sp. ZBS13]MBN1044056.1 AEC family transporter [Clostridium botulinum]
MANLILSLNVVLPLFITISFGYFLKSIKLFDDSTLKKMNNLVFKTFLPILLFYNIYTADLSVGLKPKLMLFSVLSIISCFLVLIIIIPKIEKDNKRKGVLVQAIFRSNFVLFGLPVTISLLGENNVGITSIIIAVVVPTFNFLSVISLEMYKYNKINYKNILKGIISNPLIIASLIGIFTLALGIKFPKFIDKTLLDLSRVATPLALVILGGSFEFNSIKGSLKQISLAVIGKLILVPSIFIPLSIFLGFRNAQLATLLIMFSAPVAVNSFTMADQMGADSELAGQIVVFSSTFAILTIFMWIYITKSLGYI